MWDITRRFEFARAMLCSEKGSQWLLEGNHCKLPSAPREKEFGCMLYKVPRDLSEFQTPSVAYIPNYEYGKLVYGTSMTSMMLLQFPGAETPVEPAPCRRFIAFPYAKTGFGLLESTHLSDGSLMIALTLTDDNGELEHYTFGMDNAGSTEFNQCISMHKRPDCD